MSDVSGVPASRPRPYTDEELEAMRKDAPTSAILNKARRDAGYNESDVALRGDDRSLKKVLADRPTHLAWGETAAAALHAVDVLEGVGPLAGVMHSTGKVACFLLPAAAFVAMQYSMVELERAKGEIKDAATRDQLHAAMLDRLDVPDGYRDKMMRELGVSMTNQHTAVKVSNQFALGDKALLATLQLHCDQGMNAARGMIESGQTKEAFFAANPTVAQRYAADAAFHDGFDALCWAKNDSGSPKSYKDATDKLDARDARYAAAHITFRI